MLQSLDPLHIMTFLYLYSFIQYYIYVSLILIANVLQNPKLSPYHHLYFSIQYFNGIILGIIPQISNLNANFFP